MAKRKKIIVSKYVKDISDFKAMSDDELRQYIRGASKVISSRMSKIRKSPYAQYSKSLQHYNNLRKPGKALSNGFKTKGLSRPELRRLANYVNSTVASMDTMAGLRDYQEALLKLDDIMDRDYKDAQRAWEELVVNDFDAVKDFVSSHIDEWISYVGSDGVNDVFNINEYSTEEEKYIDLFKRIKVDYNRKKAKELGLEIQMRRQSIKERPKRTMKFKGKFKK